MYIYCIVFMLILYYLVSRYLMYSYFLLIVIHWRYTV